MKYCTLVLLMTGWFFSFSLVVQSQHKVEPVANDVLKTALSAVLSGFVAERLEGAYHNRIMAQDVHQLVQPFLNRTETSCWQTEFWGKWITSAILAYRYNPTPELKTLLDKGVTDLMATQSPDGYIGNYAAGKHLQQWDIWGRKYCMLGLLNYYDLTGSKASLEAAAKIADHLVKELADTKSQIVRMGNHRGMAASSVLEPITLLYVRTGNRRYLDFAEEIVREWETDSGPRLLSRSLTPVGKRFPKPMHSWYGWEQGQKAYEMMSCYEGLLELYRVTGKETYKTAVEHTWESIRQTELNIAGSGSAMECWFGGTNYQAMAINHYQETCVTATWIKLNQQLLRLTGQAKYADAIEQTYYNALLGAMFADGSDWAKYSPLSGERLRGEQQCAMGINCCEASGPRGLFTIPLTAVMQANNGISVNFFIPGKFNLTTPGHQNLVIEQLTDYPVSGTVRLVAHLAKPEQFSMQVRNPAWSRQSSISVNKEPVAVNDPGNFIVVNRRWKEGDTIVFNLDMRGRLYQSGFNQEYFAIMRGPLVLSRDMRLGLPDTDEPLGPVPAKDGSIDLLPAEHGNNAYWITVKAFFVIESHAESGPKTIPIVLCDYASAGNTFDPSSRFRVWMPRIIDPVQLP